MRKLVFSLTIANAMALVTILITPAQALNIHTWIAPNGDDTGFCDHPTPCRTFQGAIPKTAVGGELTCLAPGNYGGPPITINKSITINCENTIGSNATGSSVGNFVITTAAADVVILRGLDLDGTGAAFGSTGLINFTGAGVLHVVKSKINSLLGPANGIRFAPSGPARLHVSDSFIANNGSTATGAGILIQPTSGVTANVKIERSVIDNNRFGIIADGAAGGTVRGLISDSSVSGNVNNGITVSTSGTSVVLGIDNVRIAGNNFGLVAGGTNAGMLVRRSFITGNATGVFTVSSGVILSYRDNSLNGNTADGLFTGAIGLQ
jgi:hypothetical protein